MNISLTRDLTYGLTVARLVLRAKSHPLGPKVNHSFGLFAFDLTWWSFSDAQGCAPQYIKDEFTALLTALSGQC